MSDRQRLVTVASYFLPAEAAVARMALQREGIAAFLEGDNLVSMQWLLANAVGGIKLQVPEADVERALDVLAGARDAAAGFDDAWGEQPQSEDLAAYDDDRLDDEAADEDDAAAADSAHQAANPYRSPRALAGDVPERAQARTQSADDEAWRALMAAILGLFVCPVALHLYSFAVLSRLQAEQVPLSRTGKLHCTVAAAIDVIACGMFLILMILIFVA